MWFQSSLKFIINLFALLFIAGCTATNINDLENDNENKIIEKKVEVIEYKREEISEELVSQVYNIIQTIYAGNIELINQKYINFDFGFYNLYKVDGIKIFTHQRIIYDVIEEDVEEISHLIARVEKEAEPFDIKIEDSKFNCSPNDDVFYGWSKSGIFLSDKTNNYLTKIMEKSNKFESNRYTKEDFEKAKMIEKTSYKVILTPDIVFYVTKIEGNWYLTVFDRITTDCSS
jgi:hypothetical protein